MKLRVASPDDVAAVVALEAQSFGAQAWGEALVAHTLASPHRVCLGAWATDEPTMLGYVVFTKPSDAHDVVDLERLAVAADQRRVGVASGLLREALSISDGCDVLCEVGEDNHAARALYASRHFVEIDRRVRYYCDGTDALVLRRAGLPGPAGDHREEGA